MHVLKDLYCDEQSKKNKKKILRKIKYHGGLLHTHVITLSSGSDYFDIIPGTVFKQKDYPRKELLIVGIASDYDSAVSLSLQMIQDFNLKYGTYFFKPFLLKEQKTLFSGFKGN